MTKALLITSIFCLKIGTFGMPYDEASGSERYQKNFYLVKKNVHRHQRKHLLKQRTVSNNWTNPIEALESLGVLDTNSPTKPMFPRLSKEENEQPYQKNLQTYPEWNEYINWDPEEPSTPYLYDCDVVITDYTHLNLGICLADIFRENRSGMHPFQTVPVL